MSVTIGMLIPPKFAAHGFEAVVTWAANIGIQALDLPDAWDTAAAVCRAHHLRIGAVQGVGMGQLMSPDDAVREVAVVRLSAQIRAMAAADVRVLFLCLVPENPTQRLADSLAIFRETFPAIAQVLEASQARAVFEGWPGPAPTYPTLGSTPEQWRAMFAAVPSPALGLNYDPSHLVRLGIDYLRVLDEFKDRIYHCHGKDTALLAEAQYRYGYLPPAFDRSPPFGGGAWRYCIPGDGVINWSSVAYALHAAAFDGCISIELEDARYWGSAEREQQGIRKAYQHLASQFG
jgi:sugar phosphate isomerase/epimerase